MWIVFGNKSQLTWVPNGQKVDGHCTVCHQPTTFYEKQITKTFRLYFVDIFDYRRHRVMACGRCDAYYATDELGPPSNPLMEDLTEGVSKAGDYAKRAVSATREYLGSGNNPLEGGLSSLLSQGRPRRSEPASNDPISRDRSEDEDGEIDIGPDYQGPARSRTSDPRSAGVGRAEDDLEARFRELEEKAKEGDGAAKGQLP
jgi:hypothetical protein